MKIRKKLYFIYLLLVIFTFSACDNSTDIPKDPDNGITETTKYKVNFETNGGSLINTIEILANTKLTLNLNPTKEGYDFLGWYFDAALKNEFKDDSKIVNDITLYAKWVETKFNVSFDTDGGSEIPSVEVKYFSSLELPLNPTKEGYNFLGWYLDAEYNQQYTANFEIRKDITLYAKWEKQEPVNLGNLVTKDEAYYNVLYGLSGEELKIELHKLLEKTHTTKLSYSDVWGALKVADKGEGNNVICIYTGVLHSFDKQDKGSAGADIWNREHVWPNSKGFGNKSHTAYSDVHHLYASNKNINATRGNKDFGDFELLGIKTYSQDSYGNKWNSTYFEPRDEVKGDLARALFYMVVRYDGDLCGKCNLDLELVKGSSTSLSNSYDSIGRLGDLETLLKWHIEDPVSEQEKARNEVVFGYQGNRNPFIDHPEFIYSLYSEYFQDSMN